MQARTFTLPFSKLGDFPELEFGDDETFTIRPLLSFDTKTVNDYLRRVSDLQERAETSDDPSALDDEAAGFICDLVAQCITGWTLRDDKGGVVPIPKTPAQLNKLPAALRGSFLNFLTTYRGDAPNPTTAA